MKPKFLLMALLCATTMSVAAQTNRGSGVAGLSLSAGTSKENRNTSALNNISFTPRLGYFLADQFLVGLEIPMNLSKLQRVDYIDWNEDYGDYRQTFGPREFSFGLSPFARKYFNLKGKFKLFAQANLLFQINSTKIIDDDGYLVDTDNRLKGIGASIRPGGSFAINENLMLEFSFPLISYFHQNYRDDESKYNYRKTNNLDLVLDNFTPTLGVSFSFH